MEKLICKNVCKSYKNKEVLKNINLELEPGKIYGLIGRNGAGKTTLLSIMSAQNPASSGEVYLGEQKVWENPMALMKLCEIDKKKQISKLSKGMMSMVTIIVALASKSDYTFLDEPVAGLDVVARDLFYKLLIQEYTESGRTFIVSTHIIDEASDVFEEVIVINNESVMFKENTSDLLERAYHISGKADVVDNAAFGKRTYGEENIGRSKGVTVLLEKGQTIAESEELSIQKPTLQNLFVALCGKEADLHDRI